MADKAKSELITFERALEQILARVFACVQEPRAMAVAYSGGLDSSVLLRMTHDYAQRAGIRLHAFHVHHGLSANADAWLAHCRDACVSLGVHFDSRHVQVERREELGLEAAAREARYAALGALCRQHDVPLLLTAHHQDDQAETVLLQLLRGAGLPGLSGMDLMLTAPDLLGSETLWLGRPLLGVSRASLRKQADIDGIPFVEDESNADVRHPRNALRQQVLPQLHGFFPSYLECITRSAQHIQSAQVLMAELAQQDLVVCQRDGRLDVAYLRTLSSERADNVLRYWLSESGLQMPSTAWLDEARTQLLWAREDAQVCVSYEGRELRRYRNDLFLVSADRNGHDVLPQEFQWQGEAEITFPDFGGTLHFDMSNEGVDAQWLRNHRLRIEFHQGGGKLKLAPNRSTRSLKDHFQERGVPVWERRRLPVVYAERALIYAAGIGQDCRVQSSGAGKNVQLRWEMSRL